jgi:hypothetical protein
MKMYQRFLFAPISAKYNYLLFSQINADEIRKKAQMNKNDFLDENVSAFFICSNQREIQLFIVLADKRR